MNICVVSPIYQIHSLPRLGKFVHEQAKELIRQGNKVIVITMGDKADKNHEVIDKVEVFRIKKPFSFLFVFCSFISILWLNRKHNFDILHSHFVGSTTLVCGFAAKLIEVPYVITVHGMGVLQKSFLKKIYLFFPNKIICVSKYVAELASRYANKDKIKIINNGVDEGKLKPTKEPNKLKEELNIKGKKVLLSVGGLVERKGFDIIIRSLPNVIKKEPNVIYILIGKGSEEEKIKLINLVKKLNLEDKVRFMGYVSDKELANYYNLCDIFLLMSRTIKEKSGVEGFGIVYIEASYMGKPVIGGKSGGTADAIEDCKTGFLIEPSDAEELERKIILLLKNKSLRDKFGECGRKRVLNGFLWKHNVEKLVGVYKGLI